MRLAPGILVSLLLLSACGRPPAAIAPAGSEPEASAAAEPALTRMLQREEATAFATYDADHDGLLTRAEVSFLAPATWARLDADGNGRVTRAEARPPASERALQRTMLARTLGQLFQRLDANGDGRLVQAETAGLDLPAALQGDFSAMVQALAAMPEPAAAPRGAGKAVVLVPGFFLPTTIWVPLQRRLAARGYAHQVTVPHFPSFGDIREVSAAAALRARQVMAQAGTEQVDLIGHSMGGLVLRYYLKELGGAAHARRYVSFGSPHHGTVIGQLWPCVSTRQMLPGSDFLTRLNADDETPGAVAYTSIRTNTDEIVLSTTSPILEGAENHLVPIAGHLELVWDPRAQAIALAALER